MGGNKQWVAVLVAATVASCGDHRPGAQEQSSEITPMAEASSQSFAAYGDETSGQGASNAFDEDQARDDAREELEGTTYIDSGAPYGCTDDCSGHEAGFAWAQENEISDAADCGGDSASFREGCEAFTEALESKVEETRSEEGED